MATLTYGMDVHTDLVKACVEGDLNLLMSLSYNNQSVFQKFVRGDLNYPHKNKYGSYKPGDYLYIACEYGHPDLVIQLIKFGAEENRPYGKTLTPLLVACKMGRIKVLEAFGSQGIDLHPDSSVFKDTPVFYCCRYGHKEMLEYIVKQIPDILLKRASGSIGESPGTKYVETWIELARIIKKEDGVLIGNLLLYIACILQYKDIVEFLVKKGVDVNTSLSKNSFYANLERPLSVACKGNNADIIDFLLENKAEITESISNQYPELTGELLKRHTQPYQRTYSVVNIVKQQKESDDRLVLYWDCIGLHKIHRHWLESYGNNIGRIDVHENKLAELPFDFFELLPNLEDLDVSCNFIERLPEQGIKTSKVSRIIACRNELVSIPLGIFMNENIGVLDLSKNKIRVLPSDENVNSGTMSPNETFWKCKALKVLKLSKNAIEELPKAIQGAKGLEKLHLDENQLRFFDTVWSCPLSDLDLSKNQLQQFSGMTQLVWSKTLHRINLAHNCIKSISTSICHLSSLQYLDISHNCIKTLPPPNNWKCNMLAKLNLSYNEFTGKSFYDGVDGDKFLPFVSTCEFPYELFQHSLQALDLSHNNLELFPDSICQLRNLCELDLSRNPNLRSIPSSLGNLKNVWNLHLTDLNIPELASSFTLNDKNLAKQILPYLRAKLRKSIPFNRMKLMIVGLQGRGKTTLLAAIQGKSQLPDDISTVGISIEQFTLPLKARLALFSSQKAEIKFSAWDLAGQQVYYATHQCFLTSQTLYLVVFNVTHGKEGIKNLSPWLANIQARAPDSRCIIVGTHTDRLPSENKRALLSTFENDITSSYAKKGFPKISGALFVSSTSGENIEHLRNRIYSVAEQMNEVGSLAHAHSPGTPNVKTAPKSYVQLYDSIIMENHRRKQKNMPPILQTEEMLNLADQNENNDIYGAEELVLATKFLHENGILLHFDDHLRELNNLFFIDPSWLCDMLALVVTVRERNPYIRDGYIGRQELMLVLKNPRLPEAFIPQYLRLLERFEIVLCLDEEKFLIPSMLPTERPNLDVELKPFIIIEAQSLDSNQCLNRTYHMSYIPAGFWSRLIARLMIAVHKWGMQVCAYGEMNTDNYSPTLWREGILVTYNDGFFLVESFYDDVEYAEWSNQGVTITVWSKDQDYSVMGFIVDHLDMLITEWYPGLEDVDSCGNNLIQKLISCPICCKNRQTVLQKENGEFKPGNQYNDTFGQYFRDPEHIQQFNLLTCALAATSFEAIFCDKHPDIHVGLDLLVPDLTLTDLPKHFVINADNFVFVPSEDTRLGEGGAGGVYLGEYNRDKVAVKQFHSTTKTKHFDTSCSEVRTTELGTVSVFRPAEQSMQEQLEDGKVIRAFWELRQEVSMLCRLQHPNIINFIGVCLSPLCFVIELAPMGSLQGILEKQQEKRDKSTENMQLENCYGTILDRFITYRIAFQVIDALYYLHDSEIIYRDLKSDNVLVWTLDENEKVNVKLSDYGIAAFATPQGVVGEGGTPGFQAPEIKYSSPYDEKVDIFSFGIWLYELLSGYRPFREFRTASEMKKAIIRGVRPNLRKDNIDTKLPFLEYIMQDCWQQSPIHRPTSEELALAFTQPDMCMLEKVFPPSDALTLQKVRVAIPLNNDNETGTGEEILVWSEHEVDRKYQIFDLQKEKIRVEKHFAGPRILCACHVENYIWLGNEGKQIEVFGQFENNPPDVLWTFQLPNHVLVMLTYQRKDVLTVFASLVNGHLCIFKKDLKSASSHQPIFSETLEDLISFEKDKWSMPANLNLGTKGYPAQCMTLTKNSTELWIGSGSSIVIVDPNTLAIKENIETNMKLNRLISLMTTDMTGYVWTCERSMSYVTQWDVGTRTKMFEYQCNVEHPTDRILISEMGSRSDTLTASSLSAEHDEQPEDVFDESKAKRELKESRANVAKILDLEPQQSRGRIFSMVTKLPNRRQSNPVDISCSKKVLTKVISKPRSWSDESQRDTLSLSPTKEHTPVDLVQPAGFVQRAIQKKPSLMYPVKGGKRSTRKDKDYVPSEIYKNSLTRPRTSRVTGKPIRVTSLMYAKGALWVGRTYGDILVISIDAGSRNIPVGKVITTLGGCHVRPLGGNNRTVTNLIPCSQDNKVLALVKHDIKSAAKSPMLRKGTSQAETSYTTAIENYQLLKYHVWSVEDIESFKEKQTLQDS